MKIIFLDIDGVLNNQSMYTNTSDTVIKTSEGHLSQNCINNLNRLVEDTDAKVVLSSVWRVKDSVPKILLDNGVRADFIGKTPLLGNRYALRGNEILAWIKDNTEIVGRAYYDYHSYVILDDDSDMLLWQRENFFQTDSYSGLTVNIAYKAARYLNRF